VNPHPEAFTKDFRETMPTCWCSTTLTRGKCAEEGKRSNLSLLSSSQGKGVVVLHHCHHRITINWPLWYRRGLAAVIFSNARVAWLPQLTNDGRGSTAP